MVMVPEEAVHGIWVLGVAVVLEINWARINKVEQKDKVNDKLINLSENFREDILTFDSH